MHVKRPACRLPFARFYVNAELLDARSSLFLSFPYFLISVGVDSSRESV